jgi:hypothetical protein
MAQGKKPVDLGRRPALMNLQIFWGKRSHGDPDNIWKGIADALFQNDNDVSGCFSSHSASDKVGRVEVEIHLR